MDIQAAIISIWIWNKLVTMTNYCSVLRLEFVDRSGPSVFRVTQKSHQPYVGIGIASIG